MNAHRLGKKLALWLLPIVLLLVLNHFSLVSVSQTHEIDVSHGRLQELLLLAFLSIGVFSADLIMPERASQLEMLTVQPISIRTTVARAFLRIYLSLNILLFGAFMLIAALFSSQLPLDWELLPATAVAQLTGTLLGGSIALLAALLGRHSRYGLLAAVLFPLTALALSSKTHRYLWLYDVLDAGIPAWWAFRLALCVVALLLLAYGLGIVVDLEWLLGRRRGAGSLQRTRRARAGFGPRETHPPSTNWLSSALLRVDNRWLSVLLYQVWDHLTRGRLILAHSAVSLIVIIPFLVDHLSHNRLSPAHDLIQSYPFAWFMFLVPIGSLIASAIVTEDRASSLEQVVLSFISPRQYLAQNIIAGVVANLWSALVCTLPVILLVAVSSSGSSSGNPFFPLVAFGGIFVYGLLPTLIYVVGLSTLLGALLARDTVSVWRIVIALALLFAFVAVPITSVAAHILVPHLGMALETSLAWFRANAPLYIHTLDDRRPIVDSLTLVLPLLSALLQVSIVWWVVGNIYHTRVQRV